LAIWLKRASIGDYHDILTYGDGDDRWYLRFNNTNVLALSMDAGGVASQDLSTGTVADATQYHHIVVVIDRDVNVSYYFDGRYDSSGSNMTAHQGHIAHATVGLKMGIRHGQADYFNGDMVVVSMYKRILPHAEIQQLYSEQYAMWEVADIPYARVAVAAASMPVIMQQMNQFDGGTAL
jgi:hypothetical protein